MSRNQKAPLLAFVLVALVCCMVLVETMRGDASDGQESASSQPASASASPVDEGPGLPADAADADPPVELSPPLGAGITGGVGPGSSSEPAGSAGGVELTSPSADGQSDLDPGAGGATGASTGATEPGDQVADRGEGSPRKAKRRGRGIKDPTEQPPAHAPGVGNPNGGNPDGGNPTGGPQQPDPVPPGPTPPSSAPPSSAPPDPAQPGAAAPSASPSPAVSQVPDLTSLLTPPALPNFAQLDQGSDQ